MDGILRLKHIEDYKKVSYYSVCLDQDEEDNCNNNESLFESFIKVQEIENKNKLNHILVWISELGQKYGADKKYFRQEQKQGEALGLPPNYANREPVYTEFGKTKSNNLRLYCHRLNNHVVILFSGALKTANTPQQCPNVKPHFELANKLTLVIDNAFKEREIAWVDDNTDIDYSDELIIYY